MPILEHLEPKAVFAFFEELCAIPHGSGNTAAAGTWLTRFAAARGLAHRRDAAGNVIIWKDAAPGYEAAPPVILQGHIDMVCEKTPDCPLDMARDGLDLAVEGDTVYARGTTLGGDDGVAVAMMLALLDGALPHPALECVFTVDEEVGMLGAQAFDAAPLRGRTMINIDSEAEGIFTVSCAGGCVANCVLPVEREPFPHGVPVRLEITGLAGGHSGTEINKGRANADMLLGRLLYALRKKTALRLISVCGGEKDNAIPNRALAELCVADVTAAAGVCRAFEAAFRTEYAGIEDGVTVLLEPGDPALPMDAGSTERVMTLLLCAPNGVQAMSPDVEGLVQTSLNLGILKTAETTVEAAFCVRSSLDSGREMLADRLQSLTERLGGRIEISGAYPGWAYRRESPLRELMTEVFTEQYGHPPVIDAIHAGLECGLFSGKLPGLDCVSIGPNLTDIHTYRERMHIASVGRTWALLTETLKRMK